MLDMNYRLAWNVKMHDIPPELIVTMDETFTYFVPMGQATTYDKTNSKQVKAQDLLMENIESTICLT